MIVTFDFWQGIINDEEVVSDPDWSTVTDAMSRLDGSIYTLIVIDNELSSSMFFGGGPSQFVIALSDSRQHLILKNGNDPGNVSIVIGGQRGDYKSRNVLPRDICEPIVAAYFNGVDVRDLAEWEDG